MKLFLIYFISVNVHINNNIKNLKIYNYFELPLNKMFLSVFNLLEILVHSSKDQLPPSTKSHTNNIKIQHPTHVHQIYQRNAGNKASSWFPLVGLQVNFPVTVQTIKSLSTGDKIANVLQIPKCITIILEKMGLERIWRGKESNSIKFSLMQSFEWKKKCT